MKVLSYDEGADVLYITLVDAEGVAEEVEDGIFVRYIDEYGLEPVGITIMDLKKRLNI